MTCMPFVTRRSNQVLCDYLCSSTVVREKYTRGKREALKAGKNRPLAFWGAKTVVVAGLPAQAALAGDDTRPSGLRAVSRSGRTSGVTMTTSGDEWEL